MKFEVSYDAKELVKEVEELKVEKKEEEKTEPGESGPGKELGTR